MALLVVVSNPLIVPGQLLHHRLGNILRRQWLFLDEIMDFVEGHDAVKACTGGLFAGALELAVKHLVACGICESVSPAVQGQTEIDFCRVQALKPEGKGSLFDVPNVRLSSDN
jgi:hypothetical protein